MKIPDIIHKIIVNVLLLVVYAFFFGQESFKKYLDNAVIITEDTEHPAFITPPAITIFPMNPIHGANEKLVNFNLCSNFTGQKFEECVGSIDFSQFPSCLNFTGQQFFICVENASYSISETLWNNYHDKLYLGEFYVSVWWGIAKSVMMEEGSINNNVFTPHLELNKSLKYMILITDPKLQLYTASPDVVARSLFTISENTRMEIYLQAVRHEKLNQPHKPCEPSPVYDFAQCVEKAIMSRAGCQPHWRRFSVEDLPECDNSSMLTRYNEEYWSVGNLYREDLVRDTGCYLPCSFFEYKASQ